MNQHQVLSAEFLEMSLTVCSGLAVTDSDFLSAKPCQGEKRVMVTDICESTWNHWPCRCRSSKLRL